MQVANKIVTICRHSGKVLKEEYNNIREVSPEEYYGPLIEVIGDLILKDWEDNE